jgi:hypothetical protein
MLSPVTASTLDSDYDDYEDGPAPAAADSDEEGVGPLERGVGEVCFSSDTGAHRMKEALKIIDFQFTTGTEDHETGRVTSQEKYRIEALGTTNPYPVVTLQDVNMGSVAVNGETATVPIQGTLMDPMMDNIPSSFDGGIKNVSVYVNGVKIQDVPVTRTSGGAATFWQQFPYKGEFGPVNVTIAAKYISTIEVVTEPNLAKLTGSDSVTVAFNEQVQVSTSGTLVRHNLFVPASFDPSQPDAIGYLGGAIQLPLDPAIQPEPLTESGNDTLTFGPSAFLGGQMVMGALIAEPDQPRVYVVSLPGGSFRDSPSGTQTLGFLESSPGSGVFQGAEFVPGEDQRPTLTYTLASVTNDPSSNPGKYGPLTIRLKGDIDPANARIVVDGHEFHVVEKDGYYYLSLNDKVVVGSLVTEGSQQTFRYWDHQASQLVSIPAPAGAESLKAEYRENGVVVQIVLRSPYMQYVDKQGRTAVPLRLPLGTLKALVAGDPVTIPNESMFKVRLYGYAKDSVARVVSTEFPDDRFDLTMPDAQSTATRKASLVKVGGYAESESYCILYSSDDTGDTLSDGEWAALKALGFLAVHNPDPTGVELDAKLIKEIGRDAYDALVKSHGTEDHHIFNAFRPNDGVPSKYTGFWKQVFGNDFDMDDYTVQWDKQKHRDNNYKITERWKAFIDQYTDADGKLLPGVKPDKAAKEAFAEMEKIADDFGYADRMHTMRRYPSSKVPRLDASRVPGSSLDKLLKTARRGGWFDPLKSQRWKKTVGMAAKILPGKRFLRYIPYVGKVMTVAALLTAASNPAQALADELDVGPGVVEAWFEGRVALSLRVPWPGKNVSVESAEFIDGGFLSVGDELWVWSRNRKKVNGRVVIGPDGQPELDASLAWMKYLPVKKINTTEEQGVYEVEFDDPHIRGMKVTLRTPGGAVPTDPVTGPN